MATVSLSMYLESGILIWHGQPTIASISNNAGQWSRSHKVDNMFDSTSSRQNQTIWHSKKGYLGHKRLDIYFKVISVKACPSEN